MTARHHSSRADTTQVRWGAGRSFVGSFLNSPDEALIVLRGEIDAAALDRVAAHLEGVRAGGARFVTVDVTAVDASDPGLLEVLRRAQQRLRAGRGWLCVRGLRPDLFAGPVADGLGEEIRTDADPRSLLDRW